MILTVILVPGVTWFLEDSLRRAQSNIIPADEELEIKICNLVKVYGRPSRFNREWNSGLKNSGTSRPARELSRMAGYATAVVVVAGAGIHVLLHVQLSSTVLLGHCFAFITWTMTLSIMNIFREFRKPETGCHCQDSTNHCYRLLLCRSDGNPDLGKQEIREQRGAIFLGMFWYLGIAARYLSNKINKENINIDLIDGRFRMLKKDHFPSGFQGSVYRGEEKPFKALNSVSMEIHTGMFGLLGPNGAGKTTLMRIICGVFEQSYGRYSLTASIPRRNGKSCKV